MGVKKIFVCHKRNSCIGCGSCVAIAPQSWQMNDEDGKSDLKGGELKKNEIVVGVIDEADYEANKIASEACPVHIIKLD